MHEAYVNDLEYEAQTSSDLLDWLKAGTDLYRVINPGPVIQPVVQPVVPVVQRATGQPFNWKPVALMGGLLALVVAVVFMFRKA